MDISGEKINMLLKNPEVMGMIANLAGSLGAQNAKSASGTSAETASETAEPTAEIKASQPEQLPALPSEIGIPNFGSDRRIALLNAIKPYVGESKKGRVDSLVRAISVAEVLNTYKGGLFGKIT